MATVGPNVTAQLAKLPVWGNLTFNPSIASGLNGLDGANYVFMEWIANQGNFDVRCKSTAVWRAQGPARSARLTKLRGPIKIPADVR